MLERERSTLGFFAIDRRLRGRAPRLAAAAAVVVSLGALGAAASVRGGPAELRVRQVRSAAARLTRPALPALPAAVAAPPRPAASPAAAAASAAVRWDLPDHENPRVDDFVKIFTGRGRDRFAGYLRRMGRYRPMIEAKLAERGMPHDLVYLAMIESGFRPRAYSHAHASGMWQFIAGTARRYGLDINRAVDERNDPEKATDAALDYLQELHDRFGSWYLAAAAYNTGENRVSRVMRRVTGSERGDESSYWKIRGRLPRETRDYVPLMIAAARIGKQPAKYGFARVDPEKPLAFDSVLVPPATPLSAVARAAGTSVAEIRALNPHFRLQRTRNDMRSAVRVPAGHAALFAAKWPQERTRLAAAKRAAKHTAARRVVRYRVRRGDNLSRIAQRHGVSVRALKRANGLRGSLIRPGQRLRIPG